MLRKFPDLRMPYLHRFYLATFLVNNYQTYTLHFSFLWGSTQTGYLKGCPKGLPQSGIRTCILIKKHLNPRLSFIIIKFHTKIFKFIQTLFIQLLLLLFQSINRLHLAHSVKKDSIFRTNSNYHYTHFPTTYICCISISFIDWL